MNDEKKPNLIHRDDLPMEAAEEITAKLKELYPGFRVVFSGDEAELPPEVVRASEDLQSHMDDSLFTGKCIDCGAQMPNFPGRDATDSELDEWNPAEGWRWFSGPTGEPQAWQCPECDRAESSEGGRP